MKSVGQRMEDEIRRLCDLTGKREMTVDVELEAVPISVRHQISLDCHYGLLVDGRPPSVEFFREAMDFHPIEPLKRVLH